MSARISEQGLGAMTLAQSSTGFAAGQAEISRMGFPVPLCGPEFRRVPLVLIPWEIYTPTLPAVKRALEQSGGAIFRIQTSQSGLFNADFWFNASDIQVPSIIYRDFSPHNNPLAFAFAVHPQRSLSGDAKVAIQSLFDGGWVTRDRECGRLITVRELSSECWFTVGAL